MGGHSILYLGRGDFAPGYLETLRASSACEELRHSSTFDVPDTAGGKSDLVLVEIGPALVQSGHTLPSLLLSLRQFPVIALTTREREVLTHVMAGRLNKQIAAALGTSEKTIKVHRARGMEKMHVRSVAELVRVVERAQRSPAGTID